MIIGITGSFGAGKGEVVKYLVSQKGFRHFSSSGFITEEIERRGLPVNRDSMIVVANDLRHKHGPAYIIESLYQRAEKEGGDVVIESLRAIAEVEKIKSLGGFVIGVDADSKLRYERAFSRGTLKDNVSYDTWLEQEKKESNSGDPTKQDVFGALKKSDTLVTNNGSLEELHVKIEDALSRLASE